MTEWRGVLGCEPDEYCDRVYGARPEWVTGSISHHDARFLFGRALRARADVLIEVGTASGVSTAILCHAAAKASAGGEIGSDFRVHAYDISKKFYADQTKDVGDATREMLDEELLEHIVFHAPATAATVREEHADDSIGFAFIDGSHKHPWPVLDLLAMLVSLRPGGEVVLHDINLPQVTPDVPTRGAQLLFDDLDLEKEADSGSPIPNIGAITVPDDKAGLREQLLAMLEKHEWEVEPHPDQVRTALG